MADHIGPDATKSDIIVPEQRNIPELVTAGGVIMNVEPRAATQYLSGLYPFPDIAHHVKTSMWTGFVGIGGHRRGPANA